MPTLDWLNRDAAFRTAAGVPTRVLRPHAQGHRFGDGMAGNLLVQGDNMEALKALLPFYRGQVKCIFIDPPYNTKSAFEHYDDNLEHSQWLSMMLPRLQLLREFLREDGSIWVTIDDNEGHYLKVLMDEVFGRGNFVANCIWQKRYSRENRSAIGDAHDHLLVYARQSEIFKSSRNKLPLQDKQTKIYKNPNNDPRGLWRAVSLSAQGYRPNQMYVITAPSGKTHLPPAGSCWKVIEERYHELVASDLIYFGKHGNAVPSRKQFLSSIEGVVPWTWWTHEEAGHNDEAKREVQMIFDGVDVFVTPKPERLIKQVLTIASNPEDLVLDSFLGSGTTAAVAHKMGRSWIGIEAGDHAVSHCLPRLQKVLAGEEGGISEAVQWRGGGGFEFLQLGAPLFDEQGDIHSEVRFPDLARFIWMRETGAALAELDSATPCLGQHEGIAYYLLFNGVLGDRRPASGNVLTTPVLDALRSACWHEGPKVIYGEACRLGEARLAQEQIVFKQLPHAVPR